MNLANPATVLLSDADARVLKVLAGTTAPLTGREIARLGGGVQSTIQRSLHRLAEHGLLQSKQVGAGVAVVYTVNKDHLAYDAIPVLVNMRLNLIARIRKLVAEWEIAPTHASMFGSGARGDGGAQSDIDLFIVQPGYAEGVAAWTEQTDSLVHSVRSWTGNHASVLDLVEGQVARLCTEGRAVVGELRRDAIHLFGLPLDAVLRGVRA